MGDGSGEPRPRKSALSQETECLMKRAMIALVLSVAVSRSSDSFGALLRFQKVSDHCFYLQLKESGENVAAIVTDEGILIVDPPSEPGLSATADALKRLSPKPVRWVVFSNPRAVLSSGARFFAQKGAMLLAGTQLRDLSASIRETDTKETAVPGGSAGELSSFPWLIFQHQINLFPSALEIRIIALQHKAMTGGDVVVHVPAEKVLFVGGLYEAARYPDIDTAAQGDAGGWVDGLKQVFDSVPVLKPAIPPKPAIAQVKTDPKAEPEKTLEEGIAVVSARGDASNFQNLKDLLIACQKLRSDISRAIKAGRSCDEFLSSTKADPYRGYGNLNAYATQLCEAVASSPEPAK